MITFLIETVTFDVQTRKGHIILLRNNYKKERMEHT